MKYVAAAIAAALVLAQGASAPSAAQESPTTSTSTSPAFTPDGELLLPADYREWVFVGTSLGMTYGPTKRPADAPLVFDNIYVTRDAYRTFTHTGKWPEKTMFVMEGRAAATHTLLANVGQTQGEAKHLEASVKDSTRFPKTGWGYYNFGSAKTPASSAKQIAATFACYSCHAENTAVENTFVQFYPALFEIATRMGTIKPTFDPGRRF